MNLPPLCASCTRFTSFDPKHPKAYCAAFPDGIPDDILKGGFDHRYAHAGDHGVRYSPATDDDSVALLDLYERVHPEAGKQSKETSNYRLVDNPAENCKNCKFRVYSEGDKHATCSKVQGTVDPQHVCDLWKSNVETRYSADQPRDADGRFGSGDGEAGTVKGVTDSELQGRATAISQSMHGATIDLTGASKEIQKGVLSSMEKFNQSYPAVRVDVRMGDRLEHDAVAETHPVLTTWREKVLRVRLFLVITLRLR